MGPRLLLCLPYIGRATIGSASKAMMRRIVHKCDGRGRGHGQPASSTGLASSVSNKASQNVLAFTERADFLMV